MPDVGASGILCMITVIPHVGESSTRVVGMLSPRIQRSQKRRQKLAILSSEGRTGCNHMPSVFSKDLKNH